MSENYFVMMMKQFGNTYYSVCSKLPWNGIKHNAMTDGMFHCGKDNWVFESPLCLDYEDLYEFDNEKSNKLYLLEFEAGESCISERNGIPIYDLYIKSAF